MRRNLDPSNLPGALRVAVKEALDSGWTAKKGGSGGWKLRSPKGTQWMHVAPGTNIPDNEAVKLRAKVKRALIEEAPEGVFEAANDPKEYGVTTVCTTCKQEFLTWDGYAAHQEACQERAAAALAAEEEAEAAVPQVEEPEPPQEIPGYRVADKMPAPSHRPDLPKASDSGKMSNKEEVVSNSGNKRGNYRKRQIVQSGLARALYAAMIKRRQYKDEALSKYANALAKIIDEDGFEYAALDDAETKLVQVYEALGIDPGALDEIEELRTENAKQAENLKALKDLFEGI